MSDAALQNFAAMLAKADPGSHDALFARARLMAMNEAPEEAFKAPIVNLGDYLARAIPVPPTLIEPYIVVRGGITATIGRAGKGKTVMNLNRIMKWGCGRPLFDTFLDNDGEVLLKPEKPIKTLIIENEGAAGLFHRQVGLMTNASEYLSDEERELVKENVLVWGDGGYSNLKLDDPKCIDMIRAGLEEWEPDIVFVEPFRGLWKGDENSSTDMAVVVDALVEIAASYNVGVMLAHHESKNGGGEGADKMSAARGSTVLEGVVSVMENFEAVHDNDFRELSWSKSRHGKIPPTVRMEWDGDSWWYRHTPMDDIGQAIIDVLASMKEDPLTVEQIMSETGEKEKKVRSLLKSLEHEKRIAKMPNSSSFGGGSTGFRYRLRTDTDDIAEQAGEDEKSDPLAF